MKRILVFIFMLSGFFAYAQSSQKGSYTVTNTKKLNLVLVNDTMSLFDGLMSSIPSGPTDTSWRGDYCFSNVKGTVSIRVNQDSNICFPDTFSISVRLLVRRWTMASGDFSDTVVLSLSYSNKTGKIYSEQAGSVFEDAHFIGLKLLSVSNAGAKQYVQISLELSEERTTCFPKLHTEKKPVILQTGKSSDTIMVQLPLNGDANDLYVKEADEFDIEWTTIDINDPENYQKGSTTIHCKYNFRHNATRVTVGKNDRTFYLKNIFEGDLVMFRYRRVTYYENDGLISRITSRWSTDSSVSTYVDNPDIGELTLITANLGSTYSGNLTSSFVLIDSLSAHLPNLNWQYLAVYAEEAKRNETISYFDGSLRNREVVTTNNSDEAVLVQENIYDYMGRQAIQVLPVPIVNGAFSYYAALNKNTGAQSYTAFDFDKDNDTNSCEVQLPALNTSSGASEYYSTSNAYLVSNLFAKYVPVAGGYPFTQTVYMPDNTGRVRFKSGVGEKHQITATGKYTEYAYETPNPDELNRLFGTEVGYASHYKKTAVIDANGQPSISYMDLKGKTIATGLAADISNGLISLDSNMGRTNIETDLIEGYTAGVSDGKLVLTKRINILQPETRQIKYSLDPQQYYPPSCTGSPCYNCIYDLDISIAEVYCGGQMLDVDLVQSGNQLLHRVIGGNPASIDSICSSTSYATATDSAIGGKIDGYIQVSLPKGTYDITKVLQVDPLAMENYEKLFLKRNICKTVTDFEQISFAEMDTNGCELSCEVCQAQFGSVSREDFITAKAEEYSNKGISLNENEQEEWGIYYDQSKIRCNELCGEKTTCEAYLDILKLDVTPGGQYAGFVYDNTGTAQLLSDTNEAYVGLNLLEANPSVPISYVNLPDDITVIIGGVVRQVKDLTLDEFIKNWDDSWADALVIFHPEYCEYTWCTTNREIFEYEQNAFETEDYKTAEDSGYLKLSNSTFFTTDPLSATQNDLYLALQSKTYPVRFSGEDHNSVVNMMGYTYLLLIHDPHNVALGAGLIDDFNACAGNKDLYWQTFRALYFSARKELLDSIKRRDPFNCAPDVAGIPGAKLRLYSNPADFPSPTKTDMTVVTNDITSLCQNTCESYKPVWEEKLKGCNLDSIQMLKILEQLKQVCIKGCDESSPIGASSVSPANALLGGYISFEDVLRRFPLADPSFAARKYIYDAAICSDVQLDYPQPYGHDYFAKESPFADTCACAEGMSLDNCPCGNYSAVTSSGNMVKMIREDVADNDKCNHCIGCSEFGAAFKEFYDQTPSFTGINDNDEALLRTFMNQRFGFNLTFDDYKKQVATCMGYNAAIDTNAFGEYIASTIGKNKTVGLFELGLMAFNPTLINYNYQLFFDEPMLAEQNKLVEYDGEILYASTDDHMIYPVLETIARPAGLRKISKIQTYSGYDHYSDIIACMCPILTKDTAGYTKRKALNPNITAFQDSVYSSCRNFKARLDAAIVRQDSTQPLLINYINAVYADFIQQIIDDPTGMWATLDWTNFPSSLECTGESGSYPPKPPVPPGACDKVMTAFSSYYISNISNTFESTVDPVIKTQDLKDYLKDPSRGSLVANLFSNLHSSAGLVVPDTMGQSELIDWLWDQMSRCKSVTCATFLSVAKGFEIQYIDSFPVDTGLYQYVTAYPDASLSLKFKELLNQNMNKPPFLTFFDQDKVDKHFMGCTQGPCKVVTDKAGAFQTTFAGVLNNSLTLVQNLRDTARAGILQILLDSVNSELIWYPYFKKFTKGDLLSAIEACVMCGTLDTSIVDSVLDELVSVKNPGATIDKNVLTSGFANLASLSAIIIRNVFSKSPYKNSLDYAIIDQSLDRSYYYAKVLNNSYQLPFYVKIYTINDKATPGNPWDYYLSPPPTTFDYFRIDNITILNILKISTTETELKVRLHFVDAGGFSKNQEALIVLPSYPFYKSLTSGQTCRKDFLLCNRAIAQYTVEVSEDPCLTRLKIAAKFNAQVAYNEYLDSLRAVFRTGYITKCLRLDTLNRLNEHFFMKYNERQYHYTLYYYDQAGNLVKTVPPAGVKPFTDIETAMINGKRDSSLVKLPSHKKVTQYRYNTLNQLVWQRTPDADSSNFYYDKVGRLVASQNAKQKISINYSYTIYDAQGRIEQVGEIHKSGITNDPATFRNPGTLASWLSSGTRTQITKTAYDTKCAFVPLEQQNLRGRVATTTYQLYDNVSTSVYDYAVHYSYDVQGNVHRLVREFKALSSIGQDMKQVDYRYDLVSGKVNSVIYQQDQADQYIHSYQYDQDNRLIKVLTGHTESELETDAEYYYYLHGPLARAELGKYGVQGIDYAYTINGWLKGVNSESLYYQRDMGHDGDTSYAPNRYMARDEFGFMLGYYTDDYAAAGGATPQKFVASKSGSGLLAETADLYNGNISMMTTAIGKFMESGLKPLATAYKYDQLNRIKEANYFNNLDSATNTWGSNGKLVGWHNRFTYDSDGNILTQVRRSSGTGGYAMDSLDYEYYPNTNRLKRVRDTLTADTVFTDDINHQVDTNNYVYDAIGNLTRDRAEEIDSIYWNVYGKITRIKRLSGSLKPDLEFAYSPDGYRIMKLVTPKRAGSLSIYTYYMRDAQGNILATYERTLNKTVNYDSLNYCAFNDSIISKTNIDAFSSFIASIHSTKIVNTGFNNYLESAINDTTASQTAFLYANSPVAMLSTGNAALVDSLIMHYDSLMLVRALSAIDLTLSICNCMTGHKPNFLEWSAQDLNAREYLFRAMSIVYPSDFNGAMSTLGCAANLTPTAITCLRSKSATSVQSVLTARGFTNCSPKLIDLYDEMFDDYQTNYEEIIARVPDFRKMIAKIGGYGCFGFSDSQLASALYGYNQTYTWDKLIEIKGRSYLVSWFKQNDLDGFLGTITKQKKYLVCNYQSAHNIYSAQGNGIESYLKYVQDYFGTNAFNSIILPFYEASKTYEDSFNLNEWMLYGSARLGIHVSGTPIFAIKAYGEITNGQLSGGGQSLDFNDMSELDLSRYTVKRGKKHYELSNHLGNVLATVSDKRLPVCVSGNVVYYKADVLSAGDYSPFGAPLTGRSYDYGKTQCTRCDSLRSLYTAWTTANGELKDTNIVKFASYANTKLGIIKTSVEYQDALTQCGLIQTTVNFNGTSTGAVTANNINLGLGSGDVTFEVWIYPRSSSTYRLIIDNVAAYSGPAYRGFQAFLVYGKFYAGFFSGGTDGGAHISSNVTVPLNQWTYISCTMHRGSPDSYTMYFNGSSVAFTINNTNTKDATAMNHAAKLAIGQSHTLNQWFDGYIRHLRLYTRQLNATEILTNYNGGCIKKPIIQKDMVFYMGLDETAGNVLNYSLQTSGSATLSNATWEFKASPGSNCMTATERAQTVFCDNEPYRHGFNGKEKDDEVVGAGNSYDYGARMYDPRLGRWRSGDPLAAKYPSWSPYVFAMNTPISAYDPDGKRVYFVGGAGNDQIGWNYTDRFKWIFEARGISGFTRINASHDDPADVRAGKTPYGDIMFTAFNRSSGWQAQGGAARGMAPALTRVQDKQIDAAVQQVLDDLAKNPLKEGEQFNLAGYSYGSVLQAHVALRLADKGIKVDNLILIGSPISTNSDLYKELTTNKNIGQVIRHDIPGDKLSNPSNFFDFKAGGTQNADPQNIGEGPHFDLARPGKQANLQIRSLADALKEKGVY